MSWKKKYRDRIYEAINKYHDEENIYLLNILDGRLYKIIKDIYMDGYVDGCADVESDKIEAVEYEAENRDCEQKEPGVDWNDLD